MGLNDGDAVVVGLDVHRKTASATTRVNGTEAARRVTPVDTAAVMGSLRAARPYVKKGGYEAGATGDGLTRALTLLLEELGQIVAWRKRVERHPAWGR